MWCREAVFVINSVQMWSDSAMRALQRSLAFIQVKALASKFLSLITPFLVLQNMTVPLSRTESTALTLEDWKHFAIYQIVTDRFAQSPSNNLTYISCSPGASHYCGGTFQGIISKLDYIQGMGFDALWISPVIANTGGNQSYHGYWAQDLYSINPHFGTAEDLRALSSALHERGMYLMVDVVANHMGPQSEYVPSTPEYVQTYKPFDQLEDYHDFCTIRDYNNQNEMEQCWLGSKPSDGLADLNTENPRVVHLLKEWIHDLVSNYSIDALRVDTVKHVRQTFWPDFVRSAGLAYCTGEVLSGDAGYVAQYQSQAGIQGLINYPVYYPLTRAFQSRAQGFDELKVMVTETVRSSFADPMALTTFLENHDNPRFPSLFAGRPLDPALVKNAITYVLTGDGIPTIYYGQEQMFNGGQDPYNREPLWLSEYSKASDLYMHIAKLNRLRKVMAASRNIPGISPITTPLTSLYNDQTAWAFSKAHLFVILSSDGSLGSDVQTIEFSISELPPDTQLIDVLSCSKSSHSLAQERMRIKLVHGQPVVLYPISLLAQSGICGE